MPKGAEGFSQPQLGEHIAAWRQYGKFTKTQLAIRAGFGERGRSSVSRIENCEQVPDLNRLRRLAQALNCGSPEELYNHMPPLPYVSPGEN
jgi:transcriptional regulator with XRE-family HTH domain